MTAPSLSRSIAAVLLCFALAGCGNIINSKTVASDAMDQFHERFNAGDYGKIYDTADADFQGTIVRADFLRFLEEAHRQLGDYRHCAVQDWSTNSSNGDPSVNLKYQTTFANGGSEETFAFHVTGSRATLRKYHLASSKLVTY